jgi:cyclopropane fatty-acyl-phospholipid synthase-like methyltransferase
MKELKNKDDLFSTKAKNYEKDKNRVDNITNISSIILSKINFTKDMHIMDFGSGTGLLLGKIAPNVAKITAIDMSKSMNEVLNAKRDEIACELDILNIDLTKNSIDLEFDSIISSMTMHHIKNIKNILTTFYNVLKKDSFIALADLKIEDGTFHKEDTGVHHFGFDTNSFKEIGKSVGFKNIKIYTLDNVVKPWKEYEMFLFVAQK